MQNRRQNDICWADRSVRIHHGKGDKSRTTYFNAEAELSLKEYLKSRKHDSQVLFCKTRAPYGHISRNALEDEVRKIRNRAADHMTITVTPTTLRHTFATTAISNGAPVQHVQRLLGHVDLNTTMTYTHMQQEEIKTTHKKCIR